MLTKLILLPLGWLVACKVTEPPVAVGLPNVALLEAEASMLLLTVILPPDVKLTDPAVAVLIDEVLAEVSMLPLTVILPPDFKLTAPAVAVLINELFAEVLISLVVISPLAESVISPAL